MNENEDYSNADPAHHTVIDRGSLRCAACMAVVVEQVYDGISLTDLVTSAELHFRDEHGLEH